VNGNLDLARSLLRRALDLDPENDDAALVLSNLPMTLVGPLTPVR
jgi:hypothetical protein